MFHHDTVRTGEGINCEFLSAREKKKKGKSSQDQDEEELGEGPREAR